MKYKGNSTAISCVVDVDSFIPLSTEALSLPEVPSTGASQSEIQKKLDLKPDLRLSVEGNNVLIRDCF